MLVNRLSADLASWKQEKNVNEIFTEGLKTIDSIDLISSFVIGVFDGLLLTFTFLLR